MAVMAVWFSCAKKTGKDHRISRERVRLTCFFLSAMAERSQVMEGAPA